jgi:alpha-tubulin suppressor-like RCC1 family protein
MWPSHELDLKYGVEAQVMAWGCGFNGRTGVGDIGGSLCPLRVGNLLGHIAVHVACGRSHSIIVTEEGKVLTMGAALHGRLGRPVLSLLALLVQKYNSDGDAAGGRWRLSEPNSSARA